jgi:outer membrane protein TolC
MGYKGVQMLPGRGNGFVAGFALIIPLVDVGRGDRLRAEAQLARARAESSWTHARVEVAHEGLDARVDALTLDDDDASAIVELAEDAYRADEIEVGVLIDAQRAWLDGETAELDLALRARLARVELDRLEGRGPTP